MTARILESHSYLPLRFLPRPDPSCESVAQIERRMRDCFRQTNRTGLRGCELTALLWEVSGRGTAWRPDIPPSSCLTPVIPR